MGEIEEHLGVTINRVGPDMAVPIDEYDGKVVYGAKRTNEGLFKLNKEIFLSLRWATIWSRSGAKRNFGRIRKFRTRSPMVLFKTVKIISICKVIILIRFFVIFVIYIF